MRLNYEVFEEYFQSSKEEVKKKLNLYRIFIGYNNVLDIGCGRKEFLELLKENQVVAEGVEVFHPFVAQY